MNTEIETAPVEITPLVGSTIVRRKFIEGVEQVGEIADSQIVKGFTGANLAPHWTERCEATATGLVCPAVVCQSGKIIPLDEFFGSWLPA